MLKFFGTILITILATSVFADVPCDFKGINVGDTMTAQAIMEKLGINKYKINPTMLSFEDKVPLMKKYGLVGTAEVVNWNIGPYCTTTACWIPFGVNIGIDIPASIFVSFSEDTHLVQVIDVEINASRWDELVPILKKKYGSNWEVETGSIVITNYESKSKSTFERPIMTHRTGGKNRKNGETCELSAVKYDIIDEHTDPLGAYHSIFEIKLISKNF